MPKRKHQLAVSIALLGCAMVLLAGCSWKNTAVTKEPEPDNLSLDKLKRDETDAKLAAEKKAKDEREAAAKTTEQSPKPMTGRQYPSAPAMSIDANKQYTATLHTDKGDIVIALDAKMTPVTVNNFVFLARDKFYDGTIFHRTIKDFMIQGGDPQGTGMGGPGYRFNDEPFTGQYSKGTIAMANSGSNTNGSQFFIMHADYPLPSNYVIFGHVAAGLDVVDAIATAPVTNNSMGENSKPVTPVKITSVDIAEQ